MSARVLTSSIPDATSGWRQGCRHDRRRPTAGRLDILTAEVLGRFLDEGVPEADVLYVASETQRCVQDMSTGNELPDQLHPWTWEILTRYEDKADSLFMAVRGSVDRA